MQKNNLWRDIWGFLKMRKAWWLTPVFLMLALVAFLIIFGQESAIAPFIYTIF